MRAPKKSRLDDVVLEIVNKLQNEPAGRFGSEVDVRATVTLLRALDQEITSRGTLKERMPIRGGRQQNAENFTALRKQVQGLRKAFQHMSTPALLLLFSGGKKIGRGTTTPHQQT